MWTAPSREISNILWNTTNMAITSGMPNLYLKFIRKPFQILHIHSYCISLLMGRSSVCGKNASNIGFKFLLIELSFLSCSKYLSDITKELQQLMHGFLSFNVIRKLQFYHFKSNFIDKITQNLNKTSKKLKKFKFF